MWLWVGWNRDPGLLSFALDPLGHVRISGLNVSWPPQYFPYVSMMELGAGGIQLGPAVCQVGEVCEVCEVSEGLLLVRFVPLEPGPNLWVHISPWGEG